MDEYNILVDKLGINGYCIECNKKLSSIKNLNYYITKEKIPNNDSGVIKPKIINGKKYHRLRCDNCFIKEFNRHPKRLNTINYDLEYLFGVSKENILLHRKKYFSVTKENLIVKYGEIEGLKKWNEYCTKQSITNKFEYKQSKYGWNINDYRHYNKNRAVTKENLIVKYGEIEGLKKWNEYCTKQSITNKLEYFIEKYGEKIGTIKYKELNRRKAITRNNLILKYGNELGETKYMEWANSKKIFYSKISQELFHILNKNLTNRKIYFAEHNQEFGIYLHETDSYAKLDFFDFYHNKAIEFLGDYWHANPLLYDINEEITYPYGIHMAKDVWEYDYIRANVIKREHNIDILFVWQYDFVNDREKCIKRCMEFLNA